LQTVEKKVEIWMGVRPELALRERNKRHGNTNIELTGVLLFFRYSIVQINATPTGMLAMLYMVLCFHSTG